MFFKNNFWSSIKTNMNQFVLLAFIVSFLYVEQYDEIYRLATELDTRTSQLQDKSAQLEAKKLMESELYSQLNERLQSLEAERDQLYEQLLEASQINRQCKTYKSQAEREIYELKRNLEMDREKLHTTERELRYANEQVDKLRVENSEGNRKIDRLEDKIRNDPRNRCNCICSSFDAFMFCTHAIYRMATYISSNFLLPALEYAFDLLKLHAHHLQIE